VQVLDIGCGAGKMARFFALNPKLQYTGFDVYRPAIDWCRKAFSPICGKRFRFEHFNGYSAMYNPGGSVATSEYCFPVADNSIDLALGASIFTHLTEVDMRHYLAETARALKPAGVALVTIHTLDELAQFFPDVAEPGDKRVLGNEQVMLIDPQYFIEMAEEHGLEILKSPGRLCGQELLVFEKK